MAQLFETFDDLKNHVSGANVNNDITTLSGYIDIAVISYMIPILGEDFWNEIAIAYDENNLSSQQQELLPYLQKPLAHFAYFEFAKDGGLQVSDSGFTTPENAMEKRPFQWQLRDFKRNRLNHAWASIQSLLNYLWAHKDDFTTWRDSEERLSIWNKIIWDINRWNRYRTIEGWGTLWALFPYVQAVVENEIAGTLGSDFMEEFLDWLNSGDSNADFDELLPYVERPLVFGTLYRAAHDLPLQITPNGVFLDEIDRGLQNDDTHKIAESNLAKLAGISKQQHDQSLKKLKKHLDSVATSSKYATYFNSDLYNENADSGSFPSELTEGPTFMM